MYNVLNPLNIKKAFRIGSHNRNGYDFIEFEIYNKFKDYDEQKLEVEFQGGTTSTTFGLNEDVINSKIKEKYWYNCSFIVKSRKSADFVFCGKLIDKLEINYDTQPHELIEKLEKLGYVWISYHNGLDDFQPVKNWPKGIIYTTYSHDNQLRKKVVAKNESEAVKKFLKICSKEVENGYNTEKWGAWLNTKHIFEMGESEQPKLPILKIPA